MADRGSRRTAAPAQRHRSAGATPAATANRSVSEAPLVFMVGSPRTGSTVLRHVLNRSPQVCIASETHFMRSAKKFKLTPRLRRIGEGDMTELDRLVADMMVEPFWVFVRRNVSTTDLRDRILRTDLTERGLFTLLLDMYVETRCGWTDGLVVGEKSPEHLSDVPRLLDWYPAARVIHTIRDPRAIYASSVRRAQEGRWGLKSRAGRTPSWILDRLVGPAELLKTSVAWHEAARRDVRYQRLLGERYHRVLYEDFVTDPGAELRRVCEFIGIPFRAVFLEEVRMVGSSFSADRHGSAGIHRSGAERWRSEISAIDRRWLELTNSRQMRRFGYLERSQPGR